MSKYATGKKPDNTNNFFLMQELDLTLFHEVSELVWAATYDEALHVRVMKRITDAAHAFQEITNAFDGVSGGEISYNWLPVRFYMAVTRGGKVDEYDGFRVDIGCKGVSRAIEVFFSKDGTYGQAGVWGRQELGGWTHRLPATPVPEGPVFDEVEPEAGGKMQIYTVWNEMRTEGFVTLDKQLAYETRKCATTNLSDEMGNPSPVAREFCEKWGDGNLTTEVREVSDKLTDLTDKGLEDLFQYYSNACERGRFTQVRNRRANHPSLHAMLLLNELAAREGENGLVMPMIPSSQQQGPLNYDIDKFKRNATRDHVLELVRCSVRFDTNERHFDLGVGNPGWDKKVKENT